MDGAMTAFVAHPDGDGPFPGPLLYMDAVGYRDQVRETARRFGAGGPTASRPTSATAPARG